jgi:hypothetical protein
VAFDDFSIRRIYFLQLEFLERKIMSGYVNFLKIKHQFDDVFIKKYVIDQRSIKLLEFIATGQLNSSPMTVSQLMHAGQFGSPATIHRSLSRLRDSNLLVFLHEGTNFRTKYPALTKDSKEYFESISKILLKMYKA